MKRKISTVFLLCALAALTSCGGDSGSTAGSGTSSSGTTCDSGLSSIASSSSSSLPSGLTVSSLTSTCSSGSSSIVKNSAINYIETKNTKRATEDCETDIGNCFDPSWNHSDKVKWLELVSQGKKADGTTDRDNCDFTIPEPSEGGGELSCYGPTVKYKFHPDQNPSFVGCDSDDVVCELPYGDLGIWTENETSKESGTVPCAAAKMNADIVSVSTYMDIMMTSYASLECLVTKGEISARPAAEDSALDVTSEFNTIVQNTDLTFTSVTWEQPSADEYVLTLNAGSMGYINFKVTFSSDDYSGYIYGAFESADSVQGTTGSRIFSTNFSYTGSSEDLKYDTRSAYSATKTVSDVSGSENDFFDSTNKYFLTEAYWTMDMKRIVSNVNGTNGLGKMFYAWQAGPHDNESQNDDVGDDSARIFNAATVDDQGTVKGYAWFGYGQNWDSSHTDGGVGGAITADGEIDRMICNWAGPNNRHDGNDGSGTDVSNGMAQAQYMTKDSSTGQWSLTESHISYAPVLDCTTETDEDNGAGIFVYDISTGDSAQVPATSTGITKDFVTLSSESEYTTHWGSGPESPLAP